MAGLENNIFVSSISPQNPTTMNIATESLIKVQTTGSTVRSVIDCLPVGQDHRRATFKKFGIDSNTNETWYPLVPLLKTLHDLQATTGGMNLFQIGKAITASAKFPPMKDLEMALNSIDIAYHMNHTLDNKPMFNPVTGKTPGIGNYNLVQFDATKRKATMICTDPYPSEFDRGIITQIVRNFRPKDSVKYQVDLDSTAESRAKNGKSCTYLITW
jgi:hypothetical protein